MRTEDQRLGDRQVLARQQGPRPAHAGSIGHQPLAVAVLQKGIDHRRCGREVVGLPPVVPLADEVEGVDPASREQALAKPGRYARGLSGTECDETDVGMERVGVRDIPDLDIVGIEQDLI